MKTILKNATVGGVFMSLLSLMFLITPVLVVAQDYNQPGLVKCQGFVTDAERASGIKQCNFAELINGVQYLINWMIYITIPITIVMFSWAGFLYMSGKEANIKKAHSIFSNVVIGFFFMLAAWLIVHSILKMLTVNDSYLFFFKK